MKPQNITIKHLEAVLDLPAEYWHGKCTLVANAAAQLIGPTCHAVYGHYVGFIEESSFWAGRAATGFVQHGWVLLEDGRVFDPTRWSFEDCEPYIYIGSVDDPDYDEGGNQWREMMAKPCPEDPGRPLPFKLSAHEEAAIREFVDSPKIGFNQIFWLANYSYEGLGPHLGTIYGILQENNLLGFIPFDNQKRAIREGFLKPSEE